MAETTAVALLFDDDALGGHLRDALRERGARIVHEGGLADLSLELLQRVDADVLVINLDDPVDDVLDRLDEALAGDRPRVVFNEAQSSRALDGWARARWARHLAAKVLAQGDVDPPRPPAPAIAEPVALELTAEEHASMAVAESTVQEDAAARSHESEIAAESESLEAELEALLSGDPLPAQENEERMPAVDDLPGSDTPSFVFDTVASGRDSDELELDDFELDELALSELDADSQAQPLYDGDFLDSVSDTDVDRDEASAVADESGADESADFSDETLRLLAELEEDEASPDLVEAEAPEAAEAAAPAVPSTPRLSDEWSLVDDSQPVAPTRPSASDFGVEKLSATDYLAPEADTDEAASEPFMTLELVSLEEAMAPKPYQSDKPSEMFLEELSGGLSRVVVIGAAADSRASVGEFLSLLPAGLRATIVHIQHLGERPVEDLVQELASRCTLSVRIAGDDQPARPGELLVVPPDSQLRLLRDGQIELKPSQGSAHSPSIDASFTAVANVFGVDALAVLFAGRGNDAVAGCQAVHDRGGRVWVEDAPGEHFADMVSGVMAEHLADFSGTAAELAARLIEEY